MELKIFNDYSDSSADFSACNCFSSSEVLASESFDTKDLIGPSPSFYFSQIINAKYFVVFFVFQIKIIRIKIYKRNFIRIGVIKPQKPAPKLQTEHTPGFSYV